MGCGRAFHCTIARGRGEGIFVVITRGRDLPEGHGMTVPRDSVTVLYIVRERYGNQSMNYFIEQTKMGICSSLFQSTPS